MKKLLLTVCAIGATCGLLASSANAVPITGNITFSGGAQLNNNGVATSTAGNATGVTSWLTEPPASAQPVVVSSSGSFDAFVTIGQTATFTNNYQFNMVGSFLLWQVGGFTFTLNQSNIVFQGPGFVTVQGFGILSGNGFDPTAGIWRFTTQDPSAGTPPTFSFSASTQALPEGGATLALLGLGLAGVEGLRRKLRRTVG
jgi:hypothetical protein